MTPIICQWDGERLVPLRRFHNVVNAEFTVGEMYRVEVIAERSERSHNHYFAALHDLWLSLPDSIAGEFPTVEKFRKRGLIETGHYDERRFATPSPAEARRFLAFLRPTDEFAVFAIAGNVVIERKAKSQSKKSMGGPTFQQSKTDVLEWAKALVGIKEEAA